MGRGRELEPLLGFVPTDEQIQVIDAFGQGTAVFAGAGCGKTTTLVAKCIALLARKPEARFAAVSFTERSASDLVLKLSRKMDLSPHWVTTIHGLCGSVVREFPREAGLEGEETVLSEAQSRALWDEVLSGLLIEPIGEALHETLETWLAKEGKKGLFWLITRLRDLDFKAGPSTLTSGLDLGLMQLAAHAANRFAQLKALRGGIDFSDLERCAVRALEHPAVREHFHGRFDLLLVDEFQDTSPIQARILGAIAKPDRSNLCVVGDPKQSIYRFRDADVSLFEEFCEALPRKVELSSNYRSHPHILETVNQVCEPLFGERYGPLHPGSHDRWKKEEEGSPLPPVLRVDSSSPKAFAAWLYKKWKSENLSLEGCAILLRRLKGGAALWLDALREVGIPLGIGSGGLFWSDSRVRECVAFLKWWHEPLNALAGATFLRAPWMGISDSVLDSWIRSGDLRKSFLTSDHVIAKALLPLQNGSGMRRPGEVLLHLLATPEIESEMGNSILGLWHHCEELSLTGLEFGEVVAEFSEAVFSERREREVPPPDDLGVLKVLTIHGSKGLEFDHVFLLDLGKKPRALPSPRLFWDRKKGVFIAPRDEDGELEAKNPDLISWKAEEKLRELAESKRLFYVALTRAKKSLVWVCPELSEGDEEKLFALVNEGDPEQEDYWRAWVEKYPVERVSANLVAQAQAKASTTEFRSADLSGGISRSARPFLSRRPRVSVSEWVKAEKGEDLVQTLKALVTFQDEGEGGFTQRELGTEVHSCLECADWPRLQALSEQVGSDRLPFEKIRSWALNSPLMEKGDELYLEFAFECAIRPKEPENGPVLVGSVDRLQRQGQLLRIIDFKVLQAPQPAAKLLASYQFQIELYAWAIKQLLDSRQSIDPEIQIEGWVVAISPDGVCEIPCTIRWDQIQGRIDRLSS